jgi:hypothetical protein
VEITQKGDADQAGSTAVFRARRLPTLKGFYQLLKIEKHRRTRHPQYDR